MWGGVGPRTDESAYEEVAKRLETPVITLDVQHEAVDATVFHLDICFAALNESSVLIIHEVFNDYDLKVNESVWEEVIRCPLDEGSPDTGYACNVHCVDGANVLIQKGNEVTIRRLRDAGFAVHPVQTEELINACKGSVFCLKMMLPSD